jgi:hypothetical protein
MRWPAWCVELLLRAAACCYALLRSGFDVRSEPVACPLMRVRIDRLLG